MRVRVAPPAEWVDVPPESMRMVVDFEVGWCVGPTGRKDATLELRGGRAGAREVYLLPRELADDLGIDLLAVIDETEDGLKQ